MSSSKAQLRKQFLTLRRDVPPIDQLRAGEALAEVILATDEFKDAGTVAAFASFGDEIPTEPLLEALRADGRLVLLPRVEASENRMVFCGFSDLHALTRDRFGIRAPDGEPHSGPLDLVFVPGLAFGRDGSRLGYGSGFYDRHLVAVETPPTGICGLCYDFQLVPHLPLDPHDVLTTHVATPRGLVRIVRDV